MKMLKDEQIMGFWLLNKQVLDSLGGKPVDINELKQLLSAKADKAEIGILNKMKADKHDTDGFQSIVKFVSTQTEHLLSLNIASLKSDIPTTNETEHAKVNKKASILSQMISLYKWSKKGDMIDGF
jgi:hypothetical protein